MTCREFVEFIMAFLDEELDDQRRAVFVGHVEACPPCKDYLDTYRETVRLGGCLCESDDPAAPAPEDAPEGLIQAILAARQSGS